MEDSEVRQVSKRDLFVRWRLWPSSRGEMIFGSEASIDDGTNLMEEEEEGKEGKKKKKRLSPMLYSVLLRIIIQQKI